MSPRFTFRGKQQEEQVYRPVIQGLEFYALWASSNACNHVFQIHYLPMRDRNSFSYACTAKLLALQQDVNDLLQIELWIEINEYCTKYREGLEPAARIQLFDDSSPVQELRDVYLSVTTFLFDIPVNRLRRSGSQAQPYTWLDRSRTREQAPRSDSLWRTGSRDEAHKQQTAGCLCDRTVFELRRRELEDIQMLGSFYILAGVLDSRLG
jgi:hypothetical protein